MVSRPRTRLVLLASVVLACAAPARVAAQACPAPVGLPEPPEAEPPGEQRIVVDADSAVYDRDSETYDFRGDVLLRRSMQSLRADELSYHHGSDRAVARGNVLIEDATLSLSADRGHLYIQERRGALDEVQFRFKSSFAHGDADQARLLDDERSRFTNVRYTGCPPDDEDWWLSARDVVLDEEEGFGTARNVSVSFLGVPILYTPYISFPIDDRRKTGFLPPTVGFSDGGLDLTAPYYLNLAPHYDLTLNPRLISDRGLLLGAEARLLQPSFSTRSEFAYLPDDRDYGDARWGASLEVRDRLRGPWYYLADLNRVSDGDYVDDFGNSLATASQSHLRSYAVAGYSGQRWRFRSELRSWQTLDDEISHARRPYRVLPRLNLDYRSPVDALLRYDLSSEFVNFHHPFEDLVDSGSRLQVAPTLSLPYERLAYYVVPTLTVSHTRYALDRPDPLAPEEIERTLPLFSVDGGLFLEREFSLRGRALLQTLEPRLFYLYVPYRNQDDLPRFDTRLADPSLGQLFSSNRFTGPDRIGDANQLSLGLGTRILDQASGREFLYAAIGQAFYFADRRVQLSPDAAREESRRSAILAEARVTAGAVTAYAEYHYDPVEKESGRSGLRLSYRPDTWKAINLGYRQRSELLGSPLEQTELSAVWPIAERWLGLAGWHYSLRDRTTLERFLGLAYNSCCWTLRTVLRENIDQHGDDSSFSFLVQLELTGLGALGRPLDDFVLETLSGRPFDD